MSTETGWTASGSTSANPVPPATAGTGPAGQARPAEPEPAPAPQPAGGQADAGQQLPGGQADAGSHGTSAEADPGSQGSGAHADPGSQGSGAQADAGSHGTSAGADPGSQGSGLQADAGSHGTSAGADPGSQGSGAHADPGGPAPAGTLPAPGSNGLDDGIDVPDTQDPLSSTVAARIDRLLGGTPDLTIVQLAEKAGVSVEFARTFWKAMGFPNVRDTTVLFGDSDVQALKVMAALIEADVIDETTAISLLRAQSHMTDRLALWQTEALVDGTARRRQLDDVSARLVVLDKITTIVDVLQAQLDYSWRRQLAALIARTDAEVAQSHHAPADPYHMPLQRGLGFVDMVAYTRRSTELGSSALADLVQTFEYTSRDVITTHGARVVKTIGDAILYVADDLPTAAEVTVKLIRALQAKENMLPVRASVVWGGVLSRNGDVFGPTVNLASRLVDVAPPGSVLTDQSTADALAASPAARQYTMVPREGVELQGLGEVRPIELRRLPD
ncbi:adenylate/guanylate cyclase domain-containing protein [Georgenia sp. AZ-5]|uniref:adenylate/guanylate cyclase domain-containing protein n=1 Tax=Georgenia sp. AZ-5 TaxID=3367526 RepID=UPI003754080D